MDLVMCMLEEAPFMVSKLHVVDDTIMFYGATTVHDVLLFWYALNCHVAYGGQVRYSSQWRCPKAVFLASMLGLS